MRETAEIALRDVPAEPKIVPELAEISVGSWEGSRRAEIEKLEPRFANPSLSERFEGYFNGPRGERFAVFSTRIRLDLEALQRPTVILAHGIVGRVLRGLWLGLERGQLAGLEGWARLYISSQRRARTGALAKPIRCRKRWPRSLPLRSVGGADRQAQVHH